MPPIDNGMTVINRGHARYLYRPFVLRYRQIYTSNKDMII